MVRAVVLPVKCLAWSRSRVVRNGRPAFDLWSRDDVRAHGTDVLDRLRDGSMPCDGAWPADQVEVCRRWNRSPACTPSAPSLNWDIVS